MPTDFIWPPYTCVATYVFESLRYNNILVDKQGLAKDLGIKVSPLVSNPYQLPTTQNSLEFGLSAADSIVAINRILSDLGSGLSFRHIKFSTIPFQMFEETFSELSKEKLIVGIGFDFSIISGNDQVNKHVAFLKKFGSEQIEIIDYYEANEGITYMVERNLFLKNVFGINDGFWVIGKKEQLKNSIV